MKSTSQVITNECPNQKEAISWGSPALSMVRYSYKSFFRVMDTAPAICVLITNNITNNVDEFDQAMSTLVDSLIFRAAMRASTSSRSSTLKFVTGKENFTTDQDIYALMQCTPNLSSGDCSN
ncbi:Cysteine-rich receptor-like protein kinase 11 [Camellia lanceoleosa]|uniref:Cysteine-rich receptor-like protein kinase 11 n=1 Tax=Camellia lanceoleosa TaxID=1840588 RepID=A0ACC0G239_9ERIC|nr:Cysteine-rich receptor-like protein kinase 11 [Camellia lanceoleosa]